MPVPWKSQVTMVQRRVVWIQLSPGAFEISDAIAKANGTAKVTIHNPDVTLGDGPNSLFANGGTALMVHAKADDMKTDPSGAAGGSVDAEDVKPTPGKQLKLRPAGVVALEWARLAQEV